MVKISYYICIVGPVMVDKTRMI